MSFWIPELPVHKSVRIKVQNDLHTSKYIINRLISPFSNCVTPDSVLLASLARQSTNDQSHGIELFVIGKPPCKNKFALLHF